MCGFKANGRNNRVVQQPVSMLVDGGWWMGYSISPHLKWISLAVSEQCRSTQYFYYSSNLSRANMLTTAVALFARQPQPEHSRTNTLNVSVRRSWENREEARCGAQTYRIPVRLSGTGAKDFLQKYLSRVRMDIRCFIALRWEREMSQGAQAYLANGGLAILRSGPSPLMPCFPVPSSMSVLA